MHVKRSYFTDVSTIGKLSIDGRFFCYTLEDKLATAIPQGKYPVEITYSPRFGKDMPLIEDVPGFTGIRIHTGNTADDTEGCLLVGTSTGTDRLYGSRDAYQMLYNRIDGALRRGEDVTIKFENFVNKTKLIITLAALGTAAYGISKFNPYQ